MRRALFLLLVAAAGAARADVAVGPALKRLPLTSAVDAGAPPSRGAPDALITIVEFADFQCPYCARAHETLVLLKAEYGSRMRLEFRHLPLAFHELAMPAAEASLAAQAQGKFWEFHDALFTRAAAQEWPLRKGPGRTNLDEVARAIGLDLKEYEAAMADHRHRARIQADLELAKTVGATGTPSFYINGRPFMGAQPLAAFRAAFAEELARAEKWRAAGYRGLALHDALVSEAPSLPPFTP